MTRGYECGLHCDLLPPWGWLYAVGAAAGFGFGMVEAVIGTIVISGITEGTGADMSRLEVFFGIIAWLLAGFACTLCLLGGILYAIYMHKKRLQTAS